jgi:hypothetical protein
MFTDIVGSAVISCLIGYVYRCCRILVVLQDRKQVPEPCEHESIGGINFGCLQMLEPKGLAVRVEAAKNVWVEEAKHAQVYADFPCG